MTAGEREGIGGGGSGDVLAKVTAGNAVYVRRSKVACRVAEFSSLALAPFAFLPSRRPPPPPSPLPHVRLSIRSSVRPSAISLLLPFTWDPAARRRLQECTKCTALTDTRPRSTASTCLLRPFASPCFFPSATPCFSLFFSLSLLHGPSFLFSPVGYSASAGHSRILYIVLPPPPLPLPGTDRFSTTGVVARLFSSTPSSYVRPSTNARTHARTNALTHAYMHALTHASERATHVSRGVCNHDLLPSPSCLITHPRERPRARINYRIIVLSRCSHIDTIYFRPSRIVAPPSRAARPSPPTPIPNLSLSFVLLPPTPHPRFFFSDTV